MRKKLLALALVTTVVLSFAACGNKNNSSAGNSNTSSGTQSSADAGNESQAASNSLADWINSDDAKAAEDATNSMLASTGMSVKLAADGNIFVYEYTLPAGDDYSGLTSEALAAAFDPVIEANKDSLTDLFSSFDSEYGIKLDGARFVFFTADGTELYSGDVENK